MGSLLPYLAGYTDRCARSFAVATRAEGIMFLGGIVTAHTSNNREKAGVHANYFPSRELQIIDSGFKHFSSTEVELIARRRQQPGQTRR